MQIAKRNSQLYIVIEFCRSLIFTIPIWIVFYQSRITIEQISFLVGFQYLIQVAGELPTGALADTMGRKITIVLGYMLSVVGTVFFPWATSFAQFLVLVGLLGIADSLLSGSMEALVYDSLKQDHHEKNFSKVVSTQSFWFQIGLVLATVAGGFMYSASEALPFLLTSLALAVAVILALQLVEPNIDSEVFTLKKYFKKIKEGVKEAFKDEPTRMMSLYYIVVGSISWSCMTYFNSFLIVDLGFGDQSRGLIQGSMRLFNILVLTHLLKNEHIFTKKISLLFFPVVMLFGLLPGFLLTGWWGIPFVAMVMMSSTARWIILTKYTNEFFDSSHRATAISTLSMAVGILCMLITLASGPIIAQYGVRMMYTILGVTSVLTVVPLSGYLVKNTSESSR